MDLINGENISIILFFIGVYGLIGRKNILKSIISIGIMDVAAILLFVSVGYKDGGIQPIGLTDVDKMVDPIPQALMITAIVIGVAVTAVSLTMFISLYHRYGTTNWQKVVKKRRGQDD